MAIDLANLRIAVDKKQVDEATDSLKKMGGEIPGVSGAVDTLGEVWDKLKNPLTAAIGLFALAGAGAIKLGMDAINAADDLNDLSVATGKASEQLQLMAQIADKSGGNLDSLNALLQKVSVGMVKGGKDFQAAMDYFGVSLVDVNGKMKSSEQFAQEVAVAYKQTEQSTERTAAATILLTKSFQDNLPTLLELNTAEAENIKMKAAGAYKTQELMVASDEYNDSLVDLGKVQEGIGNHVAGIFLPLLTQVSEALFRSATNGGLVEYALDALGKVLFIVGGALKGVAGFLIGLDTGFQLVSKSITLTVDLFDALTSWDADKAKAAWKNYTDSIVSTTADANKALVKLFSEVNTKGGGRLADEGDDGGGLDLGKTPKVKTGSSVKSGKSQYDTDLEAVNRFIGGLQTEKLALENTEIWMQKRNATLEAQKIKTISLRESMELNAHTYIDEITLLKDIQEAKKNNAEFDKAYADEDKRIAKETYDLQSAQYSKLQSLLKETSAVKTQVLMDDLAVLDKAFMDNTISVQQYEEAVARLTGKSKEVIDKTGDQMDKVFDKMRSGLADLVVSGKGSFAELASGILTEIARMLANEAFISLFEMMGVTKGGSFSAGGGGSILGTLASGVMSMDFGGQNILGGIASIFGFADGGVVNTPTFIGSHNGGLAMAGEAGPEAVIPLKNGSVPVRLSGQSGNSSPVMTFNINVTSDSTEDAGKKAKAISEQVQAIVLQTLSNERRAGNSLNPVNSFR